MTFFRSSDWDKMWSTMNRRQSSTGRRTPGKQWLIGIAALVFLFIVASIGRGIYTEWLWFGSLGFSSIYTTILTTRIWLFFAGALVFFAILMANLILARRFSPIIGDSITLGQGLVLLRRIVDLSILGAAIFLSLIFGLVTAGKWEMVLRFLNGTESGLSDPLLGRDVAFYFFDLPFYHFLQGWTMWAIVLTLIFTAAVYIINLAFRPTAVTPAIKGHLSALGAVIFLLISWNYRLSIFDLVYSERGVVFGASYTDVHAQWLAWRILIAVTAICAVLLVVNVFRRRVRLPLISIGLWIGMAILAGSIYPAIVQKFLVEPNELARERPYIERNISSTRLAFGLEGIEERDMPAELAPSEQDLAQNSTTINNIRLWDYRPLKDTYNQIQSIRLYYDFAGIDIDRYMIDGDYRQVMLGARELSPEKLASSPVRSSSAR